MSSPPPILVNSAPASLIPYRQIRALHDAETITVYQAYSAAIADAAIASQKLCASPDFLFTRMTWIKPSWNWMMLVPLPHLPYPVRGCRLSLPQVPLGIFLQRPPAIPDPSVNNEALAIRAPPIPRLRHTRATIRGRAEKASTSSVGSGA